MTLFVFMAQDDMKSGRRILTVCSRPMILESSKALLRANGDTVVMVENRVLPPRPLGLRSQPSHGRLTIVTSDGNIKGNSAGEEYSQYIQYKYSTNTLPFDGYVYIRWIALHIG